MMYNTISADIVGQLLPTLDTFEKALSAETTDESFKEGMQMIYNQVIDTLKNIGVEEIEAMNTTFDPNIHEAVMHVEDENYGEKFEYKHKEYVTESCLKMRNEEGYRLLG